MYTRAVLENLLTGFQFQSRTLPVHGHIGMVNFFDTAGI